VVVNTFGPAQRAVRGALSAKKAPDTGVPEAIRLYVGVVSSSIQMAYAPTVGRATCPNACAFVAGHYLSLYFPNVYGPVPVCVAEPLFRERDADVLHCAPNLHNGGAPFRERSITASIKNGYLVLDRFDTKSYRLLTPTTTILKLSNPFGFLPSCNSNFHFSSPLFCEDTPA